MPENHAINSQSIENLKALSPDDGGAFFRELVDIYLADTPLRLAELEQAVAKQDSPALIRAAHTIKGSSGNFGANRLAKVALEIELLGKAGTPAPAAPVFVRLKAEYALVAEALTQAARGT